MFADIQFGGHLFGQPIQDTSDFGSWTAICPEQDLWAALATKPDNWIAGLDHLEISNDGLLLVNLDGSKLLISGGQALQDPWNRIDSVASHWVDIGGRLLIQDGFLLINPEGNKLLFNTPENDNWVELEPDRRQIKQCNTVH